ncbi:cysteine hydrolase family protein [Pseudolactococcus yaeyamensis]
MKQGLLVIDVQNDYFAGGKMVLVDADKALTNVNKLEEKFTAKNLPIIYIQHIKNSKDADFFGKGTIGAALHSGLKINDSSIIIQKKFPNSFLLTNLKRTLRALKVDQLVICGMMTHMCIRATTPIAGKLGYAPILIHDATAIKDLEVGGKIKTASQGAI